MSVLIPADPDIAAPETLGSRLVGYFAQLGRAIATTFEGLTVTSSWLFRRPSTLQYPDRIEKPVQEMLPESYRGTLEMDLLRCTGCLLCAKACPIDCLGIDVEKNAASGSREIVRFDIDIGRRTD
jgi:formate hydrogenlyase subunit 6/NADH:ubiquinone oxidoreductase subunit I